ncbi:MAG: ATP synthase F1 subunit epsilon [Hyphomicrobiaceae bacterium]
MADLFKFELATPEHMPIEADARQVVVPGAEGDFTVLAGHAPLIALLRPGVLDVTLATGGRRLLVKEGFAEVSPDRLTVLVPQALDLEDLTPAHLSAELESAQTALAAAKDDYARRMAYTLVKQIEALQGGP